jgi:hypothetical protein
MKTEIQFNADASAYLKRLELEDRIRALFFWTIGLITFFGFTIFAFKPIW